MAVVMDVVSDLQTVVFEGDDMTVVAPTGQEWEITNIYVAGTALLTRYGAAAVVAGGAFSASQFGVNIHVSATDFLAFTAVDADATVGYDGIVTKRPPNVFD